MSRLSVTVEGESWGEIVAQMEELVGPALAAANPELLHAAVQLMSQPQTAHPLNAHRPHVAETVPEEPPYVAEFPPMTALAPHAQKEAAPECRIHGPMKRYPAGVSKSTNKPYNASWRCAVDKCTTKPLWDRDAA